MAIGQTLQTRAVGEGSAGADGVRQFRNWITVVVKPKVGRHMRWDFPRGPGTYAFFQGGKLVYIGSAANLGARMSGHNGQAINNSWGSLHNLDYIKYRPSKKYGDWVMLELRLIRRLKPKFNCVGSVRKSRKYGRTTHA